MQRLNRSRYWAAQFTTFGALVVLGKLALIGGHPVGTHASWVLIASLVILVLVFTLARVGASVGRLHDLDRSGWQVLWCFVPVVGLFVDVGLLVAQGVPGPNRFGPDPRPHPFPWRSFLIQVALLGAGLGCVLILPTLCR